MKIAITAQAGDLAAPVDPRFGRAKCFVVVDSDSGEMQIVDNVQNLRAAQGAGIQSARTVSDLGAGAIITGHVGPKAYQTLQAAKIRIFLGAEGTVGQAWDAYREGRLVEADSADVEGHW